MEKLKQTLTELAFSAEEAQLYLYLLKSGRSNVVQVSAGVRMHRPRVYELLASLQAKNFVHTVKHGKRQLYEAASPYELVAHLKEQQAKALAVLPELQQLKDKDERELSIEKFNGESGLTACFLDVVMSLTKGDTFYRISSAKDQTYVDSLVPPEYRTIRDAKDLERQVITSHAVGAQKQQRLERSIRFLDSEDDLFEHNVIQFIYGGKVSVLDFNSLTAVVITSKVVADFQKSVFKTLYERLPRS